MNLRDEYYLKNNLKLPVVYYNEVLNLILSSNNKEKHLICIEWMSEKNHPGKFIFGRFKFNHNGWTSQDFLVKFHSTWIYWDEYEDHIFSLVKQIKDDGMIVPKSELECLMSIWESFIFVFDSFWVENFDFGFLDILGESINYDNPLEIRYSFSKLALERIQKESNNTYLTYMRGFHSIFNNFPFWLVKIFNERVINKTP